MRKGIMALEGLEEVIGEEVPAGDAGEGAGAGEAGAAGEGDEAARREEANRAEVEEVTSFVDAPEGDLADAAAAGSEVEAVGDSISEAEATEETLDNIGDAVEESIEEGGLSEPAARAVEIAVEHLRTQVGFPKGRKFMPALEGFNDSKSRVATTKLALEGIRDTAKKVGTAIINAFNQAVEWITKFFEHLLDGAKGLAARAEALAAKAGSVQGKQAGAGVNVSASGFGKVLAVNGSFVEGTAFVSKFSEALKQTDELGKSQMELAKQGQMQMAKVFSAKTMPEINSAAENALKTMAQFAIGQKTSNKQFAKPGMQALEEVLVFGGQSFYSSTPDVATGDQHQGAPLVYTVAPATNGKEVGDIGEVAPLSAKDIVTIAKAAAEHLKRYEGFKDQLNAVKKANAEAQASAKTAGGEAVADSWIKSALANAVVRSYIKAMTGGAQKLRSYDLSIIKASLGYAGSSLKALAGQGEGTKALPGPGGKGLPAPAGT